MSLIKGVGYLLNAYQSVNLDNTELIIAGNISPEIRPIFKGLSNNSIQTVGPTNDPVSLYQKADIFISPSVSDQQPSTILEAMACGTPVIASNMCGASEIISQGEDGFVYQYDSVEELSNLLRWCHAHRHELSEMGKKAREKALRHNRLCFAEKIVENIYAHL